MNMIKYIISLTALIFSTSLYAEPTRTSLSGELFKAYDDISRFNSSYEDKFYVTASDPNLIYFVNYSSEDPFIALTLRGGQITKFERTDNGSTAHIEFIVPIASESQVEVKLNLLTKSLIQEDSIFNDENFFGAWFSSLAATSTLYPFISTQVTNGVILSYQLENGTVPYTDRLSFYLPNAALTEINNDKPLAADRIKLLISSTTKGYITIFDGAVSTQGGASGTVSYQFSETPELVQISVNPFGKTGLYGNDSAKKKKTFSLTASIRNCGNLKKVQVFKETKGDAPVLVKNAVLQQCEARIATAITEKTTYFFKFGSKIFKKTVKLIK
jgi:hypothetical protein